MTNEESASESEEIDYDTNLLSLGADAWDDSALVQAFNRDLKFYKKSHVNQLIDLSKVSNMINFKKAKKINENITSKINEEEEETGYEDQDEEDDDNDSKNDIILAPSFMPFANKNKKSNKKISEESKVNKYSSWPPQQTDKKSKRKQKRIKKENDNKNENECVETENLAKMYEEQQQREQVYGYPQPQSYGYYNNQYGQQQVPPPHQAYGGQGYYYPQQPMYGSHMHAPPPPPMPPMPPYAKSRMFNMGLNMMGPPAMSKKPDRDEALANMLLAWYWNGYYAGYQAAMEHKQ